MACFLSPSATAGPPNTWRPMPPTPWRGPNCSSIADLDSRAVDEVEGATSGMRLFALQEAPEDLVIAGYGRYGCPVCRIGEPDEEKFDHWIAHAQREHGYDVRRRPSRGSARDSLTSAGSFASSGSAADHRSARRVMRAIGSPASSPTEPRNRPELSRSLRRLRRERDPEAATENPSSEELRLPTPKRIPANSQPPNALDSASAPANSQSVDSRLTLDRRGDSVRLGRECQSHDRPPNESVA